MNPADLIGAPYELDAAGPGAFDCWGLIEYVRRECYGLATPIEAPADHAPRAVMAAITATIAAGSWRRVDPPGAPGDVVGLARKPRGELHHVGVVIPGGVLHAFSDGSTGSVVLTPFDRLRLFFPQVEVFQWPN